MTAGDCFYVRQPSNAECRLQEATSGSRRSRVICGALGRRLSARAAWGLQMSVRSRARCAAPASNAPISHLRLAILRRSQNPRPSGDRGARFHTDSKIHKFCARLNGLRRPPAGRLWMCHPNLCAAIVAASHHRSWRSGGRTAERPAGGACKTFGTV